MATASVKAGNVTKYDAGGSGDNIVANGYIKTVEKVWMDSYTLTSNVTLTNTTISIANLKPGNKLTSVQVIVETSASQTSGTIAIGFASDADGATWGSIVEPVTITHNQTISTLTFPQGGIVGAAVALTQPGGKIAMFQKEITGTQTTIAVKLNNWTMTTGTVKTIVRYT
jgi:hypothetical protein